MTQARRPHVLPGAIHHRPGVETTWSYDWVATVESERLAQTVWWLQRLRDRIGYAFVETPLPVPERVDPQIRERIETLRRGAFLTQDGGGHSLFEVVGPLPEAEALVDLAAAAVASLSADFRVQEHGPGVLGAKAAPPGAWVSLPPDLEARLRSEHPRLLP